ncbi:hypothetical protein [Frigoribacterium salinisoli]
MATTRKRGRRIAAAVLGSLVRALAAGLGAVGLALSGGFGGQAPGPDLPRPRDRYRP